MVGVRSPVPEVREAEHSRPSVSKAFKCRAVLPVFCASSLRLNYFTSMSLVIGQVDLLTYNPPFPLTHWLRDSLDLEKRWTCWRRDEFVYLSKIYLQLVMFSLQPV
jgi:hypothetical protein